MEKLEKLLELNVNNFTEKKNGLTYLSWANAWKEFVKVYPSAKYEIVKNEDGLPTFGNESMGYMVYTTVTVDELTHEMWLPVLDFRNKAVLKPSMFDVNKSVMRCLTKNLAMFGLGLYIYAGEDLPEGNSQHQVSDVRTLINNAVNHPNVTPEQKQQYITDLKSGALEISENTLSMICKNHGIQ